jgi:hypothetical protein
MEEIKAVTEPVDISSEYMPLHLKQKFPQATSSQTEI